MAAPDFDPLEVVQLLQDVPLDVRLVAISATFGKAGPGRCPSVRPIQVEMTYVGPKEDEKELSAEIRCAWRRPGAIVPMTLQVFGSSLAGLSARQVRGDPSEAGIEPRGGASRPDGGVVPAAELAEHQTRLRLLHVEKPQIGKGIRQVKHIPRYLVNLCVRRDGTVGAVRTATSQRDHQVDAAVLDALRRWRFQPARLRGEAIPVCEPISIQP